MTNQPSTIQDNKSNSS